MKIKYKDKKVQLPSDIQEELNVLNGGKIDIKKIENNLIILDKNDGNP